ncbi:MAG: SDR family NAD(P)-dependent oxidoreductase [Gammaproteobacteria bacterium]
MAEGRLAGEVALVTGSTKGIGRAIAERFAAQGAAVAITGRSVDAGREVVAGIQARGGRALFVAVDFEREDEVAAAVAATVARFGKLSVLVNNVYPTHRVTDGSDGALASISLADWEATLRSGLTGGLFLACKHAIPAIVAAQGGSIVNISSRASVVGVRRQATYTAIKGAMNALTRSIAVDYAPQRVRCNAIVVGFVVANEQTRRLAEDPVFGPAVRAQRLTRLGVPDDIAHAALWLASRESEYVTGTIVEVEGGAGAMAPSPPLIDTFEPKASG